MTTPAFRALKEVNPERRLTLLTSRSGAAIARLIPEIDNIIEFQAPWMKATQDVSFNDDYEMARQLRSCNFDAAIIFTVFSQNPLPAAYLCHLAGIPLRLAYCRENPYRLLTDWQPDPDSPSLMRHEAVRQLDLVKAIGCSVQDDRLSLSVPTQASSSVEAKLSELPGFDIEKPWIVIHPGATAESRRYRSYAAVAKMLCIEHGQQVIFTGVESEWFLVESIRYAANVTTFSLAGKLSLAEMVAIVDRAPLLITNNTGPAHIAAAVATPVVVLYALTNPQHSPRNGTSIVLSHDVECKNCFKSVCPMKHHHCLELIDPIDVVKAAMQLIQTENTVRSNGVLQKNAD
jgi:lipopolysaccharide heptosyltransferase II